MKKMTQTEADGRKVAAFCAKKPRTMAEIQSKLGGVPLWRASRAKKWVGERRILTENPFLCVCEDDGKYRHGFRRDFYDEVTPWALRELRYDARRLATATAALEQTLLTTGSVSITLGKAERVLLNRSRKILTGSQAAAEQVVAELEDVLAA